MPLGLPTSKYFSFPEWAATLLKCNRHLYKYKQKLQGKTGGASYLDEKQNKEQLALIKSFKTPNKLSPQTISNKHR